MHKATWMPIHEKRHVYLLTELAMIAICSDDETRCVGPDHFSSYRVSDASSYWSP